MIFCLWFMSRKSGFSLTSYQSTNEEKQSKSVRNREQWTEFIQ